MLLRKVRQGTQSHDLPSMSDTRRKNQGLLHLINKKKRYKNCFSTKLEKIKIEKDHEGQWERIFETSCKNYAD